MATPTVEQSRELFIGYLEKNPKALSRLNCLPEQLRETSGGLLEQLNGTLGTIVNVARDHMLIPAYDGAQTGLEVRYFPGMQVQELAAGRINNGSIQEPDVRLLMINSISLGEGNDKALARASQLRNNDHQLRSGESLRGRFLRKAGMSATYMVESTADGRFDVTIDRPGHSPSVETWAELTKRYSAGTNSYWVVGTSPSPLLNGDPAVRFRWGIAVGKEIFPEGHGGLFIDEELGYTGKTQEYAAARLKLIHGDSLPGDTLEERIWKDRTGNPGLRMATGRGFVVITADNPSETLERRASLAGLSLDEQSDLSRIFAPDEYPGYLAIVALADPNLIPSPNKRDEIDKVVGQITAGRAHRPVGKWSKPQKREHAGVSYYAFGRVATGI